MNSKLVMLFGVAALVTTTAVAKPIKDTLHFSIKTALIDTGVEPGSAASVSANESQQGTSDNRKLDVTVSGLTANTTYSLTAATGSGTVDLRDFTTDDHGKASIHLKSSGGGTNSSAFPDGLQLATVTEFDIVGGGGTVLTTIGSTPKSVNYQVKKNLTSSDSSSGTVQIKANAKSTKFTLNASGLAPDTDYNLFLNGANVQTNTTDSKGRLKIKSAPTPDNILDLNAVEVQDTGGTTVLSTTLP